MHSAISRQLYDLPCIFLRHDRYDYTISALCFQQLKAQAARKVYHIQHRSRDLHRGQDMTLNGAGLMFNNMAFVRIFNKIRPVRRLWWEYA